MKKTVMLLMGGSSDEHYLSMRSAKIVFELIDIEKYDVMPVEWQQNGAFLEYELNSMNKVKSSYQDMLGFFYHVRPDIVFIALHGNSEGNGKLAGFLDLLKIPYTGNGFIQSVVGMNKELSKLKFIHAGIKTPEFISFTRNNVQTMDEKKGVIENHLKYPCIVKPGSSGSSIGIRKIENFDDLTAHVRTLLKTDDVVLVEELISGTEYSVGVCGGTVGYDKEKFPVARLDYSGELFDEDVKKNNLYTVSVPAEISEETAELMQSTAGKIHDLLLLEGMSRSDFILTEKGDVYALEVNTLPGLSDHSIFTLMMEPDNVSGSVINNLIKWAKYDFPIVE